MRPKLYVVVGSHPCAAVEAALGWKSIEYDRVELPTLSQAVFGPLLFGGGTVPGMRLDGERLVGSRAIMGRLDELFPEPSLMPGDATAREGVLEVERWGDEVFQNSARQVIDAAFRRRPAEMASYAAEAKVQLPAPLLRAALPLTARVLARRSGADEQSARAALADLPEQLDRIDAWISDGVLGGAEPNRADLQVGSTVRLLLSAADVAPALAARPAAGLARHFPPITGAVGPGALPSDWLN